MGPNGLKFLAALLTTGIIVTPFMGLDSLPAGVRREIDSERQALTAAREKFQRARQDAGGAVPVELVRKAEADFQAADREIAALVPLSQANRRQDRAQAETLLAREREARRAAGADAERLDAIAGVERDYRAVRGVDLEPVAAAVAKAAADWPEKKSDLETRLAALRAMQEGAQRAYEQKDVAALHAAAALPARSAELQGLTRQLYESWDKVLVDLDREGKGYREKLRTVRTREGKVTSDEEWVQVSRADYRSVEKNLGMTIAHKSVGKYDSEAERTAQPAGFAYMAPPGQSNQYGHWEQRGGQSFWVWYGQYALLRDLLFNRGYRPIERGDWESYRESRSSGQTYYGRSTDSQPRYGTAAPETQSRYAGGKYAQSGGFSDSKYAVKGGYSGSKYQQPSTPPRTFGSRPASKPSFSMPRSSPRPSFGGGGRSFGRRR